MTVACIHISDIDWCMPSKWDGLRRISFVAGGMWPSDRGRLHKRSRSGQLPFNYNPLRIHGLLYLQMLLSVIAVGIVVVLGFTMVGSDFRVFKNNKVRGWASNRKRQYSFASFLICPFVSRSQLALLVALRHFTIRHLFRETKGQIKKEAKEYCLLNRLSKSPQCNRDDVDRIFFRFLFDLPFCFSKPTSSAGSPATFYYSSSVEQRILSLKPSIKVSTMQ
jgi:hypothetical protein